MLAVPAAAVPRLGNTLSYEAWHIADGPCGAIGLCLFFRLIQARVHLDHLTGLSDNAIRHVLEAPLAPLAALGLLS